LIGGLAVLILLPFAAVRACDAQIVATTLNDTELTAEWKEELKVMSGRINQCRRMLFDELKKLSESPACAAPRLGCLRPFGAVPCMFRASCSNQCCHCFGFLSADTPGDWNGLLAHSGQFESRLRLRMLKSTGTGLLLVMRCAVLPIRCFSSQFADSVVVAATTAPPARPPAREPVSLLPAFLSTAFGA
jgi:hypothetical protein